MKQKNKIDKDKKNILPNLAWLKNNDPNSWLLEEYKLLSEHYFHEDTEYRETTNIYITLNVGLLAFVSSSFYQRGTFLDYLLPAMGIILCLSWLGVLIRIREWRNYIEYRISEIEKSLHIVWALDSEFVPLDIRTFKGWKKTRPQVKPLNLLIILFRNIPSTATMYFIPIAFIFSWTALFIIRILP